MKTIKIEPYEKYAGRELIVGKSKVQSYISYISTVDNVSGFQIFIPLTRDDTQIIIDELTKNLEE